MTDQLYSDHKNGLEWESAVTEIKQVFQCGAKKFQHQSVVFAARSKIVDMRKPICNNEYSTPHKLFAHMQHTLQLLLFIYNTYWLESEENLSLLKSSGVYYSTIRDEHMKVQMHISINI